MDADDFASLDGNAAGQHLDLEPALEFDDSELASTRLDVALEETADETLFGAEDDDFEDAFGDSEDEDFADVRRLGIVEVVGADRFARTAITIFACRVPPAFDWMRFLRFLRSVLDRFVESDYVLVYFHFGLQNKPSVRWLWTAFRAFDRKYKKNLKALLLVHPTQFVRIILGVFRPVISAKFGRKVHQISRLQELDAFLHTKQLLLPQPVLDHDRRALRDRQTPPSAAKPPPPPTQQFRVSLHFLRQHSDDAVPRVMRACVAFLATDDVIQTEGLFRRSANASAVRELQRRFDAGLDVDFAAEEDGAHAAAALLKSFLRELEEPLLTFDLYDDVIDFQQIASREEKAVVARSVVHQRLPQHNRAILRFLVAFLERVRDRADMNKMTASNLAIVFGPNLLWSDRKQPSLQSITAVNAFTEFLFRNPDLVLQQ